MREYQDAHLRYLRTRPQPAIALFGRAIGRSQTEEAELAKRYLMQARAALLTHWETSGRVTQEVLR